MSALDVIATITLLSVSMSAVPTLARRRFADPMRLQLFFALFLMGSGNALSHPSAMSFADGHTFIGFTKITYNLMIMLGLCLMIGFLRERPLRRLPPPWPSEVVACAICIMGMLAVTFLIPPCLRSHTTTPALLDDMRVRSFYTLGNLYLAGGYTACAVLAGRRSTRGRMLRRTSLIAISGGLYGLAMSCALRLLLVNLPTPREGILPTGLAQSIGQMSVIAVCAGLSLPLLATGWTMLHQHKACRSQFRDLTELWCRLMAIYPELVLDHRSRRRDPLLVDAFTVYRRYIECRDGLTRLGPYLKLASVDGPASGAASSAERAAELVQQALDLHRSSDLDVRSIAGSVGIFADDGHSGPADYEEDLLLIIQISRELGSARTKTSGAPPMTQAPPLK